MILYKDLPEIFKFFSANGYMLHQYRCGFGWCFNNGYNIFTLTVRKKMCYMNHRSIIINENFGITNYEEYVGGGETKDVIDKDSLYYYIKKYRDEYQKIMKCYKQKEIDKRKAELEQDFKHEETKI